MYVFRAPAASDGVIHTAVITDRRAVETVNVADWRSKRKMDWRYCRTPKIFMIICFGAHKPVSDGDLDQTMKSEEGLAKPLAGMPE
jgi:hypothetical protein